MVFTQDYRYQILVNVLTVGRDSMQTGKAVQILLHASFFFLLVCVIPINERPDVMEF